MHPIPNYITSKQNLKIQKSDPQNIMSEIQNNANLNILPQNNKHNNTEMRNDLKKFIMAKVAEDLSIYD